MKKDICLTNGRLGFGQKKNGQKQKSLHPSQLWPKKMGFEWIGSRQIKVGVEQTVE